MENQLKPRTRVRRDYPNWIYSNRADIGDQLKTIRCNLGISAKILAERCNIDASNLCRVELGKYNISLDLLSVIVNELGCEIKIVSIYDKNY